MAEKLTDLSIEQVAETKQPRFCTVLILISSIIFLGAFFVVDGHYIIDEMIYLWSAYQMATDGSLIVQNGYEEFPLQSLDFGFLKPGPNGLAPQYPVGMALVGGIAYYFADIRGLILLNTLSAIATIFLTRWLALLLFFNWKVASLAALLTVFSTFWLEYAYAIWPHMITVASLLAGVCSAWTALKEDETGSKRAHIWAIATGMALGFGFLFRVDTILALPTIGIAAILWATRPVRLLLAGAAGLLPFFTVASLANAYKFGTYNPLSYGPAKGGTDLSSYSLLIAALSAALLLTVLLRFLPRRAGTTLTFAFGVVLFCVAALVPEARVVTKDYLVGALSLMIDVRALPDGSPGVLHQEGSTVTVWSAQKKAVLQSMPWAALACLVLLRPWLNTNWRAFLFCLLFILFWTAPLFPLAWHGGYSNNMRYLAPLVPFLACLSAYFWNEISCNSGSADRPVLAGAVLGVCLWVAWARIGPGKFLGSQQILPLWIGLFLLFSAWIALLPVKHRRHFALIAQVFFAAAVSVGAIHGIYDLANAQLERSELKGVSARLDQIQGPALVLQLPVFLEAFIYDESLLIAYGRSDGFQEIATAGYDIWVSEVNAPLALELNPKLEFNGERFRLTSKDLLKLELIEP